MSAFTSSPRFLPRVMWADAVSCAGSGALQLAFTAPMARLTGLPADLLLGTGVFLLVYAAAAAWMATCPVPPRTLIGLVVVGNFGWAVGCVALLASGAVAVTMLGTVWVALQALTVVVLAELQWMGLRRPRPATGVAVAN